MADYKGIKGFKVESLASDPTANEGQIWYNTASYALKYDAVGAGAWASGGALNTGTNQNVGFGTQTAGLSATGNSAAGNSLTVTEEYNGSAWTEVNVTNDPRYGAGGAGTQIAAIIFGGFKQIGGVPSGAQVETETYDGTSWTEVADLPVARNDTMGAGTTTAAICFGGHPVPTMPADTVSWNGSSWSAANDLQGGTAFAAAFGTQTAALTAGGGPSYPALDTAEIYDGTSWSEQNDFGGSTSPFPGGGAVAVTEEWNGTSWTEVADMATERGKLAGANAAPNTLSMAMGGNEDNSPSLGTLTEEWSGAPAVVKTVTVS